MIGYVISILVTMALLTLGFVAGTVAERRHFRRIEEYETQLAPVVRTNSRVFLTPRPGAKPPTLVCAEMVVASDYFKNFLAAFRKFFGGEMKSYHSLMDRARRETVVRLLEEAQAQGYNAICNVRLEPADVGGSTSNSRGAIMVCILGSATAYHSDIAVQFPTQPPVKTKPPVKP